MTRKWLIATVALALTVSCSANEDGSGPPDSGQPSSSTSSNAASVPDGTQEHPDVIEVVVSSDAPGVFDFEVTISSPYDSPDRYADAWRVMGKDGTVYGIRELLHDHANEQPFTRSLDGVEISEGVDEVVVEARDSVNGWGGKTAEATLPGDG